MEELGAELHFKEEEEEIKIEEILEEAQEADFEDSTEALGIHLNFIYLYYKLIRFFWLYTPEKTPYTSAYTFLHAPCRGHVPSVLQGTGYLMKNKNL